MPSPAARKELELTLPDGAAADQISIVLDGKAVTAQLAGDGSLTIPLAGDSGDGSHLLELQYRFLQRPRRGAMSLEMPRLGHGAWVRRLYWQLILPRDEHLLASPEGFAGEQTWTWNGCCWGRQPLLNQSQLENWVGLRQPTPLRRAEQRVPLQRFRQRRPLRRCTRPAARGSCCWPRGPLCWPGCC